MTDFIVVVILVVVIGAAVRYIYKAKKSGAKCIGCSVGDCGSGGCSCGCGGSEKSVKETSSCCCHTDEN